MNRYFRVLNGICFSSIQRGLKGGAHDLAAASTFASLAAEQMPSRERRRLQYHVQSIPSVSLGDILSSRQPLVRITAQRYEDGMLPIDQLFLLLAILVAENPQTVLEIGTFMGHTAKAMAMNLPKAIIHTVDLPQDFLVETSLSIEIPKDDFHLMAKRKVGREYLGTKYEVRIQQHFADTAAWDFREAQGATFFFIDGSHTYEYVKNDSEKCFDLVRGKGVFVWHDCDLDHPGIVRLIREWREMGRDVVRINGTCLAYWKNT